MTHRTGLIVLLALAAGSCAAAELRSPGTGGLEPTPFEFGGYVEARLRHYQLNRDGAFYQLLFAGQPQRDTLDRTSAMLKLTGSTRGDEWSFRFRTHSEVEHDQISHDSENRFDELYASWKPGRDFSLDAGKIVLRWGKGYSWNPVAFVERPKDPSDPRLPREGYTLIAASVSRDFPGALRTVAFTPVLLPVTEDVNSDFGGRGSPCSAAAREPSTAKNTIRTASSCACTSTSDFRDLPWRSWRLGVLAANFPGLTKRWSRHRLG